MFKNADYIAHRREKDGEVQWLSKHLKEASKKTGEFTSKVGLQKQGELIGLLHDIGKASKKFEQYIKSAVGLIDPDEDDYIDAAGMKGKIDHSTAGAQLIYQDLANKSSQGLFVAQVLSLCIASHHSGLIDCVTPEGVDIYSKRMAKIDEKTHVNEIFSKISDEMKEKIKTLLQSDQLRQNILDRVKALRTPIDSKETLAFKYGLMLRFLFSCLIDADCLSTADFEMPAIAKLRNHGDYENWAVLIKRLNKKLEAFDSKGINAIRHKISQACYDFADRPKVCIS